MAPRINPSDPVTRKFSYDALNQLSTFPNLAENIHQKLGVLYADLAAKRGWDGISVQPGNISINNFACDSGAPSDASHTLVQFQRIANMFGKISQKLTSPDAAPRVKIDPNQAVHYSLAMKDLCKTLQQNQDIE
nr:hypothetical protein 4 [bacterium]